MELALRIIVEHRGPALDLSTLIERIDIMAGTLEDLTAALTKLGADVKAHDDAQAQNVAALKAELDKLNADTPPTVDFGPALAIVAEIDSGLDDHALAVAAAVADATAPDTSGTAPIAG